MNKREFGHLLTVLVSVLGVGGCEPAVQSMPAARDERPAGFADRRLEDFVGCWELTWDNLRGDRDQFMLVTPDSVRLTRQFSSVAQRRRRVFPATRIDGRNFDPEREHWSAMPWERFLHNLWWSLDGEVGELHAGAYAEGWWSITFRREGATLVGDAVSGVGDSATVTASNISCDSGV